MNKKHFPIFQFYDGILSWKKAKGNETRLNALMWNFRMILYLFMFTRVTVPAQIMCEFSGVLYVLCFVSISTHSACELNNWQTNRTWIRFVESFLFSVVFTQRPKFLNIGQQRQWHEHAWEWSDIIVDLATAAVTADGKSKADGTKLCVALCWPWKKPN